MDGKVEEVNIAEDWLFDSGKWFYFDKQGVMVNNTTLKIEGKDYVFTKNGVCTNKVQTGWVIDCNFRSYYFDDNGVMLKNTTVKGNKLDEDGRLVKPESRFTSNDPSQYPGWYIQNDKWHCKFQGEDLIKTWLTIGNDKWFYFDGQGALVSNTTLKIDRKDYVFDEYGVCTNKDRGWEYYDGKWHYYDDNGEVLKNTTVDGYKIDADGYRVESENNNTSDAGDVYEHSSIVYIN